MRNYLFKLILIPLVILFLNSCVLLFYPSQLILLPVWLPVVCLNLFLAVDLFIRKRSLKKDTYNTVAVILAFLAFPLLAAAPFAERSIFNQAGKSVFDVITGLGLVLELTGGMVLILGRLKLGRLGTTIIALEDNPGLIVSGIYKYIRNPIYLGMILLTTGYGIALHGFLAAGCMGVFMLVFCLSRIKKEEKMLEGAFGEKYLEYKRTSKKLIPFIY